MLSLAQLSVDLGLVALGAGSSAIDPYALPIQTGRRTVEGKPGTLDLFVGGSDSVDRRLLAVEALELHEPAMCADPLLLLLDRPMPLVEGALSDVGLMLPFVGEPLALVGQALPLIRQPVPLIGQPVPLLH